MFLYLQEEFFLLAHKKWCVMGIEIDHNIQETPFI